jgi:SAM-dependent methyltransferase
MGFSNEWNNVYLDNTHLSVWPWTDLVSLFIPKFRELVNQGKNAEDISVLEVGCGAGANIPLFSALGVKYIGIDGSQHIVENLRKRYPKYQFEIKDFTKELNVDNSIDFDFIVDRASITHNDTKSIKRTLDLIFERLNDSGVFIGIDWFSQEHDGYSQGNFTDAFTKKNESKGYFSGLGNVHFSTKEHILELFENFRIIELSEKKVEYLMGGNNFSNFGSFNILAQKDVRIKR